MNPFKLIRKAGRLMRGGVSPAQVFLGAFLAFIIGFIPGLNMTLALALFLLLVLNANLSAALVAFAIAKPLSFILAPVTFRIGHFLIHGAGLERALAATSDIPVLALMDLHVYCLSGGLVAAVVLGLIPALILAGLVKAVGGATFETTTPEGTAVRPPRSAIIRLIIRLLLGKQKEPAHTERPAGIFRKGGLIAVALFVLLAAAIEFLVLDWAFRKGVEEGGALAIGAETDVKSAGLSIAHASLSLQDLQITDPQKPTHNFFQAGSLSGDIAVSRLLAKQLLVEDLRVSDLRLGSARQAPGKVFVQPEEPEQPPWPSVLDYFKDVESLKEYLAKGREYLAWAVPAGGEKETPAEQEKPKKDLLDIDALVEAAKEKGWHKLSAADILVQRPAVVIRKLDLDRLILTKDAQPWRIHASGLSSHPAQHTEPMLISVLRSEAEHPVLALNLNFHQPGLGHHLEANIEGIPVGGVIKTSEKAPVKLEGGRAAVSASGSFSAEAVDIAFTVTLTDFTASLREGRSMLGLDRDTAQKILSNLKRLRVSGSLEGPPHLPRLKLDLRKTLDDIARALVETGRAELAKQVDGFKQQLTDRVESERDRLKAAAEKELEKAKEEAQKAVAEETQKLGDEVKEKVGDEAKKALDGALKNLFKRE